MGEFCTIRENRGPYKPGPHFTTGKSGPKSINGSNSEHLQNAKLYLKKSSEIKNTSANI